MNEIILTAFVAIQAGATRDIEIVVVDKNGIVTCSEFELTIRTPGVTRIGMLTLAPDGKTFYSDVNDNLPAIEPHEGLELHGTVKCKGKKYEIRKFDLRKNPIHAKIDPLKQQPNNQSTTPRTVVNSIQRGDQRCNTPWIPSYPGRFSLGACCDPCDPCCPQPIPSCEIPQCAILGSREISEEKLQYVTLPKYEERYVALPNIKLPTTPVLLKDSRLEGLTLVR